MFEHRYHNDATGRLAYDPKVLLKILLYGYYRGIVSSRRLAEACCRNVVFMALSADSRPHFTTIASFVSRLEHEIASLFGDVLLYASALGLIGMEHFAVDGCKCAAIAESAKPSRALFDQWGHLVACNRPGADSDEREHFSDNASSQLTEPEFVVCLSRDPSDVAPASAAQCSGTNVCCSRCSASKGLWGRRAGTGLPHQPFQGDHVM